jgi:hypothetical protein
MKRFGASTVQETPNGMYCLYADHLAEVTALKWRIAALEAQAEQKNQDQVAASSALRNDPNGLSEYAKPVSEQNARYAIEGAIDYGRRGWMPPPSGEHWLMPFWKMGLQLARAEGLQGLTDEQIAAVWDLHSRARDYSPYTLREHVLRFTRGLLDSPVQIAVSEHSAADSSLLSKGPNNG